MYSTPVIPQVVVQMMGQQTGGHCIPLQTHALQINGISGLPQIDFTPYSSDISRHNRPQIIQVYILKFLTFNLKYKYIEKKKKISFLIQNLYFCKCF